VESFLEEIMKKFLIVGIVGLAMSLHGADVIPNECAFPAAKRLINVAFTAQGVSNGTYAIASTNTFSLTNIVGSVTSVYSVVKGTIQ
jgi:hypothetical protein